MKALKMLSGEEWLIMFTLGNDVLFQLNDHNNIIQSLYC